MLRIRHFEQFYSILCILICAACFVATAVVLFGHTPPVFNQSERARVFINTGTLVIFFLVVSALLAGFWLEQLLAFRRPILLVLTAIGTLNLLCYGFDKVFVSVRGSVVKSAVYTARAPDGEIYLAQPNPLSPLGFRSARMETKNSNGHRILFLGSSYISGSGSTLETNYPQALERALNRLEPGVGANVFSGGVNGYGLVDDRLLYEYLIQEGYHFDTVVLTVMLGSDPTNDIPGTTRSAIIGQPQRLQEGFFLRNFYPLNTSLFRTALYLNAAFNQAWEGASGGGPQDASCVQNPGFAAFSIERARLYYAPGGESRVDMAFDMRQIDTLAAAASRNGSQFKLILLPDPNADLSNYRARIHNNNMGWGWIAQYILKNAGTKYPVFDLSKYFADRTDLYHCDDTHWNDRGNLYAADITAQYLAGRLP